MMNILIYIYDQVEVLDFSGPFEVFSTASRVCGADPLFNVLLISDSGNTVQARGGFSVNPSCGFGNHPTPDILIIPGGVHTFEMQKPHVVSWIAETHKQATLTASVCTGVFLLAEAGVVSNHKVTTHWEDISDLRESYPALTVTEKVRWVDEGRIITSAGISAGIDMCLHIVGRVHSKELAEKTAVQMEFDWRAP